MLYLEHFLFFEVIKLTIPLSTLRRLKEKTFSSMQELHCEIFFETHLPLLLSLPQLLFKAFSTNFFNPSDTKKNSEAPGQVLAENFKSVNGHINP